MRNDNTPMRSRKLDQGLSLFFGFGLAGPTHRFLGMFPELISL
jgi:hypothetical protein